MYVYVCMYMYTWMSEDSYVYMYLYVCMHVCILRMESSGWNARLGSYEYVYVLCIHTKTFNSILVCIHACSVCASRLYALPSALPELHRWMRRTPAAALRIGRRPPRPPERGSAARDSIPPLTLRMYVCMYVCMNVCMCYHVLICVCV